MWLIAQPILLIIPYTCNALLLEKNLLYYLLYLEYSYDSIISATVQFWYVYMVAEVQEAHILMGSFTV